MLKSKDYSKIILLLILAFGHVSGSDQKHQEPTMGTVIEEALEMRRQRFEEQKHNDQLAIEREKMLNSCRERSLKNLREGIGLVKDVVDISKGCMAAYDHWKKYTDPNTIPPAHPTHKGLCFFHGYASFLEIQDIKASWGTNEIRETERATRRLSQCQGKPTCTIKASNYVLAQPIPGEQKPKWNWFEYTYPQRWWYGKHIDPAKGETKYVEVTYSCVGKNGRWPIQKTERFIEGEDIILTCKNVNSIWPGIEEYIPQSTRKLWVDTDNSKR